MVKRGLQKVLRANKIGSFQNLKYKQSVYFSIAERGDAANRVDELRCTQLLVATKNSCSAIVKVILAVARKIIILSKQGVLKFGL